MLSNNHKKLTEELKKLPTGGITYKKINGKESRLPDVNEVD